VPHFTAFLRDFLPEIAKPNLIGQFAFFFRRKGLAKAFRPYAASGDQASAAEYAAGCEIVLLNINETGETLG